MRIYLLLKATGDFKHSGKYYLHQGRWHLLMPNKPAPKGAPISAHPHSAGKHQPAQHFTEEQWDKLKLPDTNVNAPVFNKQLMKLKEYSENGNISAILGAGYGTNTYAKKLVSVANSLLEQHGVTHKVTAGQKAGDHSAVQHVPEPVAVEPEQAKDEQKDEPKDDAKAEPEDKPADPPAKAGHKLPEIPQYKDGKETAGVAEYYAKVSQKVLDAATQQGGKAVQEMMDKGTTPNAKGKIGNTWAGKTANSKQFLKFVGEVIAATHGLTHEDVELPKHDEEVPDTTKLAEAFKQAKAKDPEPEQTGAPQKPDVTSQHWADTANEIESLIGKKDAEGLKTHVKLSQNLSSDQAKAVHAYALEGLKYVGGAMDEPSLAGKPEKPKFESSSWSNIVGTIEAFIEGNHTDHLKASIESLSSMETDEAKKTYQYAKDGLAYLTGASAEDGPKEGDTKEGADGTLIFQNGRWHKQAKAEAAEQSASKPDLSGVNWQAMYLPDTNVNAKSHNKKIDAIKKLAEAGDTEGLSNFKTGSNTYGKQQAKLVSKLLAVMAVAPKIEAQAAPAAAAAPAPAQKDGEVPNHPDGPTPTTHNVMDSWKYEAESGNTTALMNKLDAFEKNKGILAKLGKETYELMANYAKQLKEYAANYMPAPEDDSGNYQANYTDHSQHPAHPKVALNGGWANELQAADAAIEANDMDALMEQAETASNFVSAGGVAVAQYIGNAMLHLQYLQSQKKDKPAKTAAPAGSKPVKPAELNSGDWKALIEDVDVAIENKDLPSLYYKQKMASVFNSATGKMAAQYIKDAIEYVKKETGVTDDNQPQVGAKYTSAQGISYTKVEKGWENQDGELFPDGKNKATAINLVNGFDPHPAWNKHSVINVEHVLNFATVADPKIDPVAILQKIAPNGMPDGEFVDNLNGEGVFKFKDGKWYGDGVTKPEPTAAAKPTATKVKAGEKPEQLTGLAVGSAAEAEANLLDEIVVSIDKLASQDQYGFTHAHDKIKQIKAEINSMAHWTNEDNQPVKEYASQVLAYAQSKLSEKLMPSSEPAPEGTAVTYQGSTYHLTDGVWSKGYGSPVHEHGLLAGMLHVKAGYSPAHVLSSDNEKIKGAVVLMADMGIDPEVALAAMKAKSPKDGDIKVINGITYKLINGRWHKVDMDPETAPVHPLDKLDMSGIAKETGFDLKSPYYKAAHEVVLKMKLDHAAYIKDAVTQHKDGSVSFEGAGYNWKKMKPDSSSEKNAELAKFVLSAIEAATGKPSKAKAAQASQKKKQAAATQAYTNAGGTTSASTGKGSLYGEVTTHPKIDSWEKVGGQLGSNSGGKYKDPDGVEWYCKFPDDENAAKAEVLAAKLYKLAGLGAQDAKLITKDGKVGIASKWVDLSKASASTLAGADDVALGFATDAWLANWDVVGLAYDNLQMDKDGKAIRIDAGGSLMYRAQGGKKAFGDTVPEIDSLLDPKINPQSASVFGHMTKADLTASVAKVVNLSNSEIRKLVMASGYGTPEEREALAATLIARKNYLAEKFPNAVKKKEKVKPVFNPANITTPPDFTNFNGSGKGLSSHNEINEANNSAVNTIYQSAIKGDLRTIKNVKIKLFNKDTKQFDSEVPASEAPSQHVKAYWQNTYNEVDVQLNPPRLAEIGEISASGSMAELSESMPPVPSGKQVAAIDSHHKIGFYIILGKAASVTPDLIPKKDNSVISSSSWIQKAKETWSKASNAAKESFSDYKSTSGAKAINTALRTGNLNGKYGGYTAQQHKDHMKELLVDVPEGSTFVRHMGEKGYGTTPDSLMIKQLEDFLLNAESGTIVQEPAFSSSSFTGANQILSNNNIQWNFTAAAGVKVMPAWLGANVGEGEGLYPPNQRYMILGAKKVGKTVVVDAILLPYKE